MFNGNKKKEVTAETLQNEKISTIIAQDVTVHGGITAHDSVRIDGKVEGDVTITESLIVGKDAEITGNIEAAGVALAGKVTGNVSAPKGLVTLSDTAHVTGDITTSKIVIDENAFFQGNCNMQAESGSSDSDA